MDGHIENVDFFYVCVICVLFLFFSFPFVVVFGFLWSMKREKNINSVVMCCKWIAKRFHVKTNETLYIGDACILQFLFISCGYAFQQPRKKENQHDSRVSWMYFKLVRMSMNCFFIHYLSISFTIFVEIRFFLSSTCKPREQTNTLFALIDNWISLHIQDTNIMNKSKWKNWRTTRIRFISCN